MKVQNRIITTHSEAETIDFAKEFSKDVTQGDVIFLQGDLGMGKSVFARALIRCLCNDQDIDVPSPTFTLVQMYDAPCGTLWHFDLYRLSDPSEIYEIGWEEALADGVTLVEWPERLGSLRPSNAVSLVFTAQGDAPDSRTIEVSTS